MWWGDFVFHAPHGMGGLIAIMLYLSLIGASRVTKNARVTKKPAKVGKGADPSRAHEGHEGKEARQMSVDAMSSNGEHLIEFWDNELAFGCKLVHYGWPYWASYCLWIVPGTLDLGR